MNRSIKPDPPVELVRLYLEMIRPATHLVGFRSDGLHA